MAKKTKKTTKKKTAVKKKTTAKKAKVKAKAKKKTTAKKVTAKKKTAAKKKTKKTVKKTVKKKAVKKAVKKVVRKAVRKQKPKKHALLTKAEVKHFMAILLKKRAEIIGDVNSIESEALRKSRLESGGDLSSMPIHMADVGSDNFEQEFALELMDGERKMLVEINDALKRIVEKRYGICEGTKNPISKARLEAIPWSRYCIEYAIMVEKGQIVEGEKIYDEDDEANYDIDDFNYANDDKL